MTHKYTDFTRRLFLLGADLVDNEKDLSGLRNELLDLKATSEYEYFQAEMKELKKTFQRLRKEFCILFDASQH